MQPHRRAIATAAAITALSCAAPATAHADDQNLNRCDEAGVRIALTELKGIHIPAGIDWKNGPGGTATASRETGLTVSLELNAAFEVGADALVAKAKTTYGVKATASASVKEVLGYSHAIPAGRYGHLQFGNWGNRFTVTRTVTNSSCTVTDYKKGSVTIPNVASWGYRYWDTSR